MSIDKPTPKQIEEMMKEKDNLCMIKFSWSNMYVMPYDQGIKLMEAMKTAEYMKGYSDNEMVIKPLSRDELSMNPISLDEYIMYKFRYLMRKDNDTDE